MSSKTWGAGIGWAAVLALAAGAGCAALGGAGTVVPPPLTGFQPGPSTPITAQQLLPRQSRQGFYRIAAGPDAGALVRFTFEPQGNRWVLTKEGLTRHELVYDELGNVLIVREVNFRVNREIVYDPPIMLLSAALDTNRPVTGTSQVTIRELGLGGITYQGTCTWEMLFAGTHLIHTVAGDMESYFVRLSHHLSLPMTHVALTVDFGYVIHEGMTSINVYQTAWVLGLTANNETWRLERVF